MMTKLTCFISSVKAQSVHCILNVILLFYRLSAEGWCVWCKSCLFYNYWLKISPSNSAPKFRPRRYWLSRYVWKKCCASHSSTAFPRPWVCQAEIYPPVLWIGKAGVYVKAQIEASCHLLFQAFTAWWCSVTLQWWSRCEQTEVVLTELKTASYWEKWLLSQCSLTLWLTSQWCELTQLSVKGLICKLSRRLNTQVIRVAVYSRYKSHFLWQCDFHSCSVITDPAAQSLMKATIRKCHHHWLILTL